MERRRDPARRPQRPEARTVRRTPRPAVVSPRDRSLEPAAYARQVVLLERYAKVIGGLHREVDHFQSGERRPQLVPYRLARHLGLHPDDRGQAYKWMNGSRHVPRAELLTMIETLLTMQEARRGE